MWFKFNKNPQNRSSSEDSGRGKRKSRDCKCILFSLILLLTPAFGNGIIKIYMRNELYFENVKKALVKLDIPFEKVQSLNHNDKNLHIIDDFINLDLKTLPKYYIAYQTTDSRQVPYTPSFVAGLSNAIAVWDISRSNIDTYKQQIPQYYYFPSDYEFSDTVILPCLLPTDALETYKELLAYSNKHNTDISSHLPILFVRGLLKNPKMILELGVRSGQSTISHSKVQKYFGAKLVGVDIDCNSDKVYSRLTGSKFFCMSDLDFPDYYKNDPEYAGKKFDIIFIDTSHLYEHTMQEIAAYMPLLSNNGMFVFHDSNVTPLENGTTYMRINNTFDYTPGNTRGVTQAIKEYFKIDFDESVYCKSTITMNGSAFEMTHYPFCNGLTIIEKK